MLGAFHLLRILSSTPRAASLFCELSIWRVNSFLKSMRTPRNSCALNTSATGWLKPNRHFHYWYYNEWYIKNATTTPQPADWNKLDTPTRSNIRLGDLGDCRIHGRRRQRALGAPSSWWHACGSFNRCSMPHGFWTPGLMELVDYSHIWGCNVEMRHTSLLYLGSKKIATWDQEHTHTHEYIYIYYIYYI